jgi:hypothetical protein
VLLGEDETSKAWRTSAVPILLLEDTKLVTDVLETMRSACSLWLSLGRGMVRLSLSGRGRRIGGGSEVWDVSTDGRGVESTLGLVGQV